MELEGQKKDFDNYLKSSQKVSFDPIRALHQKNLEIKEDFLRRFDRVLSLDDEIAKMEVDTSAYDTLFSRA